MSGFSDIKSRKAALVLTTVGAISCAVFAVLAITENSLLLLSGSAAGALYGKIGFNRYKRGC